MMKLYRLWWTMMMKYDDEVDDYELWLCIDDDELWSCADDEVA